MALSDISAAVVRAAPDVDPEIRRFVETVAADLATHPDLASVPPADARLILELVRARWAADGPVMAATLETELPTRHGPVRMRVHRPLPGVALPVLFYLHGGGWTFFSLDTHDRLMREYAARAGVAVAGIDYALAPEARFPVALEQTIDALRWLEAAGPEFDLDPDRIAIGGDSAGANLAVAACLALRTAGEGRLVRGMLLNYGAFDGRSAARGTNRYGGPGYMLGAEEMQGYWRNYVNAESELELPLVSPLCADLSGLPPSLLVIPECDLLAEQSHAMAERLRRAGVPVEARVYPGATHSFLEAASVARVSRAALADSASWLRTVLADTTRGGVA